MNHSASLLYALEGWETLFHAPPSEFYDMCQLVWSCICPFNDTEEVSTDLLSSCSLQQYREAAEFKFIKGLRVYLTQDLRFHK